MNVRPVGALKLKDFFHFFYLFDKKEEDDDEEDNARKKKLSKPKNFEENVHCKRIL